MVATLAAGAVLCVSSCTSQVPGPDLPEISTERAEELIEASRDGQWRLVTSRFPDAKRPDVAVVRQVDQSEWANAVVACMHDAGYTGTSVLEDGGIDWGLIPQGQGESQAVALYECIASYPLEPRFLESWNESQLRYLYAYVSGELRRCLEAEGISVAPAPSEQAFVDSGGTWSPYIDVEVPRDRWYELNDLCPQFPDGLYG